MIIAVALALLLTPTPPARNAAAFSISTLQWQAVKTLTWQDVDDQDFFQTQSPFYGFANDYRADTSPEDALHAYAQTCPRGEITFRSPTPLPDGAEATEGVITGVDSVQRTWAKGEKGHYLFGGEYTQWKEASRWHQWSWNAPAGSQWLLATASEPVHADQDYRALVLTPDEPKTPSREDVSSIPDPCLAVFEAKGGLRYVRTLPFQAALRQQKLPPTPPLPTPLPSSFTEKPSTVGVRFRCAVANDGASVVALKVSASSTTFFFFYNNVGALTQTLCINDFHPVSVAARQGQWLVEGRQLKPGQHIDDPLYTGMCGVCTAGPRLWLKLTASGSVQLAVKE